MSGFQVVSSCGEKHDELVIEYSALTTFAAQSSWQAKGVLNS